MADKPFVGAYGQAQYLIGLLMRAEADGEPHAAEYMAQLRRLVRRKSAPAHRPPERVDMEFLRFICEPPQRTVGAWLRHKFPEKSKDWRDAEAPTWRKRLEAGIGKLEQAWWQACRPSREELRTGRPRAASLVTLARRIGCELELPRDADMVMWAVESASKRNTVQA